MPQSTRGIRKTFLLRGKIEIFWQPDNAIVECFFFARFFEATGMCT